MSKVLIVDDEPGYRKHLNRFLSEEGYEVRTASSGREAIDVGCAFRPDVLVVDWMLKRHIHGLHVSEVLQTVDPETKTILITGYPSPDLRDKANRLNVLDFIEKPLELNTLFQAVRNAVTTTGVSNTVAPIPIFEVDLSYGIVYANPTARALFAATRAGLNAKSLVALVGERAPDLLEDAASDWIEIHPHADARLPPWQIRTKELENRSWLVILCESSQQEVVRQHPVVRLILELDVTDDIASSLTAPLLVLDARPTTRHLTFQRFQQRGCQCRSAEDLPQAMGWLVDDPSIQHVLLGPEVPGEVSRVVESLRDLRPDITLVGTGPAHCQDLFADAGVKRFVPTPWQVREIVQVFTNRIGDCKTCGLPLPLLKPEPPERGESWACALCNHIYWGFFDDGCAPDHRNHAYRVKASGAGH